MITNSIHPCNFLTFINTDSNEVILPVLYETGSISSHRVQQIFNIINETLTEVKNAKALYFDTLGSEICTFEIVNRRVSHI